MPPPSTTSTQPAANATLVHQLFEGVLTSETRCLTCETVSSRDESFLDLSIDIEQNSSVTACLRQFSASEMLCQRNKFFCDACCDLQEAEKRMKIKRLPNVLALHLKRFKYQEDVGKYIKLTYRVAFPFELRLFNTVDDAENPDRLYELFAIVVHIGNGPHHGHYVSVVKARGTWYLFDDDSVEPVKESEIPKYFGESNAGSAYVLYYQAVDLDVAALGLHPPTITPSAAHTTESPSVSHTTSLPSTTEYGEQDAASPAVPPGLTDTPNEPDAPSPSPSPPTFTSPFTPAASQSSQLAQTSQPALSLKIPIPPSSAEPAPNSPVTPGGSSQRGFFKPLRHSPSLSARIRSANGSSSSEQRKSLVDAPPVPPIPIAHTPSRQNEPSSTAESGERSPAPLYGSPPIAPNPHINGKEKEKEKGWFRRKSTRADKPPANSSPSIAERSTSLGGAAVEENSTPWYKSTKKVMRRASEAGLNDHSMNLVIPSSAPEPATLSRSSPMSPVLRSVPENKKSTPELIVVGKTEGRTHRHRPSTAGATVGRPLSAASPPVSYMPASPWSPLSGGHKPATPDDDISRARTLSTDANDTGLLPSGGGHSWHHSHQRPHTSHAPASPSSLGFSTSNGTSSTLSTNGEMASTGSTVSTVPVTKAKRATRKLSLTAPMLGFGRRDKEKRPQSPAQHASRDR